MNRHPNSNPDRAPSDAPPTESHDAGSQRTIASTVTVEGHGLFSPDNSTATFKPAPENTGIVFSRADLPASEPIPALIDFAESLPRRTMLKRGDTSIDLVEHALAAVAGLGIDNCVIEVHGPELPAGDGSAKHFTDALLTAGVSDQSAPRKPLIITDPISISQGDGAIVALPPTDAEYDISYRLDFGPGSSIPPGTCAESIKHDAFATRIAPARTFSSETDATAAREAGFFTHLSPENFLVFGDQGPIDNSLRFPDEPARHKLLDVVGDLALVGRPIRGRIIAHRSGHEHNRELARRLVRHSAPSTGSGVVPLRAIFDILPHRYPMLLVDRVIENHNGQSAVGIKNVTINEPFFQGHYPQNPIMPGVLIIESMGQLAGLMLAERIDFDGKIALLLALDGVKLRKAVVPGDQLRLHAEAIRFRPRLAEVHCHATVDGDDAAEARVKFMLVDKAFDPR